MWTLEDAILNETQKLVANIARLNEVLAMNNGAEVDQLIAKLRNVEKKMSTVFTLFKASVYASNFKQKVDLPQLSAEQEDTNRPPHA
ncbi:hypothetical protein EC973_005314 [Apophysomyces ossiformis]|uniref:DASH complex subunit DAD3 n=1 Tax=Apophysomyces ossiformis TaxID=679940 RepID=A0A8H7BSB1_9FUNG|nr:hypothetical protein EC973_005314 [Apophysomyces ossiformis]